MVNLKIIKHYDEFLDNNYHVVEKKLRYMEVEIYVDDELLYKSKTENIAVQDEMEITQYDANGVRL